MEDLFPTGIRPGPFIYIRGSRSIGYPNFQSSKTQHGVEWGRRPSWRGVGVEKMVDREQRVGGSGEGGHIGVKKGWADQKWRGE